MIAVEISNPKKRNGAQKVKSGCRTCKVRKVKCDETKPNCQRCTKTGRTCDGYTSDTLNSLHKLARQRAGGSTQELGSSSQERRGFIYFVSNTVRDLSGYFSSTFWERLVLQAGSSNLTIRHAVIAIGTLNEVYMEKRLSYYSERQSEGVTFAVNQYLKAITQLRKCLATGKQDPLSALMACILFVCFDSLRGFFSSAMIHLRSGLKILGDVKFRSGETSDIIENDIIPLYLRLSVQAILYIDTRSTSEKREFASKVSHILPEDTKTPEVFISLEQARDSLIRASNCIWRIFYVCDADSPMAEQPEEVFRLQLQCPTRLAIWKAACENYMATNACTLNSMQLRGAALLTMHHIILTILVEATPTMDNPRRFTDVFNDFNVFHSRTKDFQTIVALAKSILMGAEDDSRAGRPGLSQSFSTDIGIIAPLYYTCCRCNHFPTRLAAIALLRRCPRREGMWDSEAGTRMIERFWEMENRCRVLEQQVSDTTGEHIYPSDVIDLTLDDKNRWNWEWKSRTSTPGLDAGISMTSSIATSTETESMNDTSVESDLLKHDWQRKYVQPVGGPMVTANGVSRTALQLNALARPYQNTDPVGKKSSRSVAFIESGLQHMDQGHLLAKPVSPSLGLISSPGMIIKDPEIRPEEDRDADKIARVRRPSHGSTTMRSIFQEA